MNKIVVLFTAFWFAASTVGADDFSKTTQLDELFAELKASTPENYIDIENRIFNLFSQSGSASVDYLLERGYDALDKEQLLTAIDHLSAAIDSAPEFAEAYNARAQAYFMLGEHGLAVNDIKFALIHNPRHFASLAGLGFIMEELQRPEAALAAYLEAQKLHPYVEHVNLAIDRLRKNVEGSDI